MAGFMRKRRKGAKKKRTVGSFLDERTIRSFQKARIQKKLTQGELARIVGTKQSAISRFESGRYNPSIEFLQKLARALGRRIEVKLK